MALRWKNLFRRLGAKPDKPTKEAPDLYYDIAPIDATEATYRLIVGQRSNGKTYSVCKHIIDII